MSILDEELTERDDYVYVENSFVWWLLWVMGLLKGLSGIWLILLGYEKGFNMWITICLGVVAMVLGFGLIYFMQWVKVKPIVTEWKE